MTRAWIALSFALVAICATMTGCGRSTLDIGYDGDDESFALAQEAAGMWNEACRGRLVVVHRGPSDLPMTSVAGPLGYPDGRQGSTRLVDDQAVSIVFNSARPSRSILAAIAHEMGHALGLKHTGEGLMMAVMSPTTDLYITAEDCRDIR